MTQELLATEVLGPDGRLAARLPDYESRAPQMAMADAVTQALDKRRHLMVEAGTGTGKSFAYLVPAILYATEGQLDESIPKRRIVISTHTISLQEQLLGKDLPLLNSVIPREFSAVLVKGRGNYVSLRRLGSAVLRASSLFHQTEEIEQLATLQKWSSRTADGSKADLTFRPFSSVWDEVASDSGNCLGRQCPRHQDCFYFRARRRTQHAEILVVNHALFFSDLALRQVGISLLPDYDAVVFDEAHTIEAVAGDHMGLRLTSSQVDYNLRRLFNDQTNKGLLVDGVSQKAQRLVNHCRDIAAETFGELDAWYAEQTGQFNGRIRAPQIIPNEFSTAMTELAAAVKYRGDQISDEAKRQDYLAASTRVASLADLFKRWLDQSLEDNVYWIDRSFDRQGRVRLGLAAAPLDVGTVLREQLFQQVPSVIMTSATLTTGREDFGFFQSRLGVTRTETLKVGSPFDYQRQCTLVTVGDMPDPAQQRDQYERLLPQMIARYVIRTRGRAFVLFTSYDLLKRAATQLSGVLREHDIAIYSQAEGLPRHLMLERFKADDRAVLFGTDSFWQGVDVPGDSLQNVIITKLPFRVPDQPLLQARMEAVRDAGGNPFADLQLPEAVIRFRQGFGRLIRTSHDQGIVVVLDSRIVRKAYGRLFLESLPDCREVQHSVHDADDSVDVPY